MARSEKFEHARCDRCIYSESVGYGYALRCRRYPPTINDRMNISPKEWCGDFVRDGSTRVIEKT